MQVAILTGSIAMGKSTIANLLRVKGIAVFCADACVHELYKQPEIVKQICLMFGDVVTEGAVDRQKLSQYILNNKTDRRKLEKFIHERVRFCEIEFLAKEKAKNSSLAVLDIALYFETGAVKKIGDYDIDKIILVQATTEQQTARALARPNMNSEKLQKILSLQMSSEEKAARADYVIDNSGTMAYAEEQIEAILKSMGINYGAR